MQSLKTFLIAFIAGLIVFSILAVIISQFITGTMKDSTDKNPPAKEPAISMQAEKE